MLKSEKLIFISAERIQGVSQKNQKAYDMGTLTISDSLESVDLPIVPELAELANTQFKKGDPIVITVDALKRFGRHVLTVTAVNAHSAVPAK